METETTDLIYREATCRLLPILPEEELQAFDEELNYTHSHGLDASTHPLQEDANQYATEFAEIMGEYFPPEWSELGRQYVELALFHSGKP